MSTRFASKTVMLSFTVVLTFVLATALLLPTVGVAGKGKDKFEVCHFTGTYDFGEGEVPIGHVINIAESALKAHIKHGDLEYFKVIDLPNGTEVCFEEEINLSPCDEMANNVVPNCGFESDTDNWLTYPEGTTFTWEDTETHSGNGAGKLWAESGSGVGAIVYSECIPMGDYPIPTSWEDWDLGVWLKTPEGSNSYPVCVVVWLTSESSPCADSSHELVSVIAHPHPDGWVYAKAEGTLPKDVFLYSVVDVDCTGDSPLTVLVDDVSLVPRDQVELECTSNTDCSDDIYCGILGRCTCSNGSCVCSDQECESLMGYPGFCEDKRMNACTYHCSDPYYFNCAAGPSCEEDGLCDCINGYCGCSLDEQCENSEACKKQGRCNCVDNLCRCITDTDCENSTISCPILGMCRCVNGLCRQ